MNFRERNILYMNVFVELMLFLGFRGDDNFINLGIFWEVSIEYGFFKLEG